MSGRVLVLGGYGTFGALICQGLAERGVPISIAGRSEARASALARQLPNADVTVRRMDATEDVEVQLADDPPAVLVHTAGPFQTQDYAVAEACIQRGVHYVDLSDSRAFVAGIDRLDEAAQSAGIAVISGASTVPALSSAVLDHYAPRFARMTHLHYGIAPGQRTARGLATAKAILSYAGKPLTQSGKRAPARHGWGQLHRHRFPQLGGRWMASCEAPDLDLFPGRYGLEDVHFAAGMEMAPVHLGLWVLAGLVRLGLPLNLPPLAPALLWLADLFNPIGSEDGGMFVHVRGAGRDGAPLQINWDLEVFQGHGPKVPTVPAILLAERLRRGDVRPGARACMGLISLQDYLAALPASHIKVTAD